MKRIYILKSLGTKKKILFLALLIISIDIAILLNIPFLRQILGFLFLTILPGLLILQILNLNKLEFTEKFVLSVGLSISFLMLFGLLINNLSLNIGYETPLATISILISFNIAFIVLGIVGYTINKNLIKTGELHPSALLDFTLKKYLPNLNLSASEKAFLVVPILFPALSIFGMHVMNTTDNNTILMFLLFSIPIYVVFVCFFNHKFPKRLYPIVIFLISISLLFLMSLRSNHIIGADTHVEYYLFQTTLDNLHWRPSIMGSVLDACLSISLLPTIYQSILNMNREFLFKILYPLVYSISPLVIYIMSKRYIKELYAFLASCFFMFQFNFLWTTCHSRTCIAILFFALAMMALFNDRIDPLKKRFLFIVFMASCMVAHYSTTYIFFFVLLGAFIGVEILSKKYTFKKVISLTLVTLFFIFIFFWYSQVTEVPFNTGVVFITNTVKSLNTFFIEESRGGSIQAMLGQDIEQKGIPHKIEFLFTWLTFVFIGIGIVTFIRRYKEMSFPESNFKKQDFLKEKFEVEYLMIALACAGLLVVMVALPYVSVGYGLDRMYVLAITILSIFFVIGGITLSKHFFFFVKRKPVLKEKQKEWRKGEIWKGKENASEVRAYLIILLILIPYFLCVSGVMYNIFGVPRSITLNSEGEQYDLCYIHDQESCAAKWLSEYVENKLWIYADRYYGYDIMISQGKRSPYSIKRDSLFNSDYICLSHDLFQGKLIKDGSYTNSVEEISYTLNKTNKIYDDDVIIYKKQ